MTTEHSIDDDDGDDSWIDEAEHKDLAKYLRKAYASLDAAERKIKVAVMRGFIEASERLEMNGPESVWQLADQYRIQVEALKEPS